MSWSDTPRAVLPMISARPCKVGIRSVAFGFTGGAVLEFWKPLPPDFKGAGFAEKATYWLARDRFLLGLAAHTSSDGPAQ